MAMTLKEYDMVKVLSRIDELERKMKAATDVFMAIENVFSFSGSPDTNKSRFETAMIEFDMEYVQRFVPEYRKTLLDKWKANKG